MDDNQGIFRERLLEIIKKNSLRSTGLSDQCSPISDTTILSSMFTGCDLMDHVGTQLPLALTAAAMAAGASTLAVLVLV